MSKKITGGTFLIGVALIMTSVFCCVGWSAEPTAAASLSRLRQLGAIVEPIEEGLALRISESGSLTHSRWEHWDGNADDLLLLGDIETITELHLDLTPEKLGDLAVLPRIQGLQKLTVLIYGAEDAEALVENVARCESLERLCISCPKLRDDDLKPLKTAPKLRELIVFSMRNTEHSLHAIAEIKTLEVVELRLTPVGEAGVRHLTGLPRLTEFRVTPGRLSGEARTWVKQNLPNCKLFETLSEP